MQQAPDNSIDGYLKRLRRALDFIDAHLDEELSVERLSRAAACSKFHFHRQFTEFFGVSLHQYVRLARLKRAAHQLAFRATSIVEIALGNGYESHEAFSRAFKKALGQTPSEFRAGPHWIDMHDTFRSNANIRSRYMTTNYHLTDVELVDFPRTRVAALTHRGDPRRLGETLRAFIAWRRQNKLHPSVSATFNIAHDDPSTTPPDDFRFDVCAATDRPIAENAAGVHEQVIPEGPCAMIRHVGSDDTLESAIRFLYAEWLPQSGRELRDFPLFFQRVRFMPEVPEHEAVVDVFLPLRA
jgi:AraC family transcriptional regulator